MRYVIARMSDKGPMFYVGPTGFDRLYWSNQPPFAKVFGTMDEATFFLKITGRDTFVTTLEFIDVVNDRPIGSKRKPWWKRLFNARK